MATKRYLLLTLCTLLVGGCSMFDRDNRRVLGWLDRNAAPSSPGARYALLPVSVPAGIVALGVDAVVVHPVCVIDDAWGDTVELLWSPQDESSMRRALFAPFAALATPFVFAGDWLWRATWPVDPREPDPGGREGDA